MRGERWFPPLTPVGPVLARGIAAGPDEDFDQLRWMLLSALFAPVSIWLDPYRAITNANYYNRLVGAQGGPRIYEGSFTDIPNDPQS